MFIIEVVKCNVGCCFYGDDIVETREISECSIISFMICCNDFNVTRLGLKGLNVTSKVSFFRIESQGFACQRYVTNFLSLHC